MVMEVLSALIRRGDEWSLLQRLPVRSIPHRASLYADDLIMFISPEESDINLIKEILGLFEGASGLACNMSKCQIVPIRCQQQHIDLAQACFPCIISGFPLKYLGIPLSPHKLPKSALQPMLDKMADYLPVWKGQLLNRSGRLALI